MSDKAKCSRCGKWDDVVYSSEFELTFLRWMDGKRRYRVCSDCAKQLREWLETPHAE